MALDWDAWIGQEEEPQEQSGVLTPPPVLDDLIQQATEEDLQLESKIKEFTSDDITIPRPKTIEEYPDKLVLSPVLVDGLFRKGRKGILTADAKAGKSFFAIELAICVSAGHPFLGRNCKKSKVCYFNYEIDELEFMQRVKDVAAALKISVDEFKDNLKIVHMRGLSIPLGKMAGNIIALLLQEYKDTRDPFSLIILDPIYKISAGDENSAEAVGKFCNNLDKIARETDCAIFYTHHHAKGDQGGKKAMDRGSGSGVFARDADLMIDLTALEIDGQTKAALQNSHMCEFWKKKLDETGEEWRNRCTPSDLKSSGSLAAIYQSIAMMDAAKFSIMVMNEQQRFETELEKTRAFRMEFVVRSFESPEPQNVTFRHPIHCLDESGALVMAEPESHILGMKKRETANVKEKKMDTFVETVDQLIISSSEGYTSYSEIAEALDIDARTVTRRLGTLLNRYTIEKSGSGRGAIAKIRFLSFEDND